MLMTNVDVSDGLTNGSMGVVLRFIFDEQTGKVKMVLVRFDGEDVGLNAQNGSLCKSLDPEAVPISKGQASFVVNGCKSCNAS